MFVVGNWKCICIRDYIQQTSQLVQVIRAPKKQNMKVHSFIDVWDKFSGTSFKLTDDYSEILVEIAYLQNCSDLWKKLKINNYLTILSVFEMKCF